jgi:hypothetical protein
LFLNFETLLLQLTVNLKWIAGSELLKFYSKF